MDSPQNLVLLRNASDGIHILDRDGNVLEASDSFCEMLGYTREQVIGLNVRQWDAHLTSEEITQAMREDFATPRRRVLQTRFRRSDGTVRDVEINCATVHLNDVLVLFNSARDVTERKRVEKRIHRLAYYDQLTGLPNRQLLHERLAWTLARSAHCGGFGALLVANLDDFKRVNDTLGLSGGDELLRDVAARLRAEATEGRTLARVDGAEFMMLLESLGDQPLSAAVKAREFGLKLTDLLSGAYVLSEGEVHVGVSVGATIVSGQQQSFEDVIRQANVALHEAKTAGHRSMRFFNPRMQESVKTRATLEAELRKAIDAEQFRLHYQVQVDEAGRAIGAEALLRWQHPERGLVPPGEFIAPAEQMRLIIPIGQWVIDSACAQLARWSRSMRTRDLAMSVNVSPLQFQQRDFVERVLGSIRRHGVQARLLELEMTETLLQGDLERTVETMKALKAQGVRFALDDFGTGYSSLQYLQRLPLDRLKIDRSFVHDITTDPNGKAIVGAILAMSRHLNLEVIAEGVETEEQRAVLRGCGCTLFQGYLFGRPMPVEQVFPAEKAMVG